MTFSMPVFYEHKFIGVVALDTDVQDIKVIVRDR